MVMSIARQVALRAGCPVGVSAQTIDRQCSSGLMAIATAAKQIIVDGMNICIAGGQRRNIQTMQSSGQTHDWGGANGEVQI